LDTIGYESGSETDSNLLNQSKIITVMLGYVKLGVEIILPPIECLDVTLDTCLILLS